MARVQPNVRVVYHEGAEAEFARSAEFRDFMQEVGDQVARIAAGLAPVGQPVSHGGAASIHAETNLTPKGWRARISWSKAHYYMGFSEVGTKYMEPRPFLVPAIEEARL
jgi:HK97 gp10 family phage protein